MEYSDHSDIVVETSTSTLLTKKVSICKAFAFFALRCDTPGKPNKKSRRVSCMETATSSVALFTSPRTSILYAHIMEIVIDLLC